MACPPLDLLWAKGTEMNLSILERLTTLRVLPNLETLMNLYLCLSFTDEEVEDLKIVADSENGQMSWVGDRIVDIPIGEKGMALIAEAFIQAALNNKLTLEHMSAYAKFVSE